MAEGIDGTIKSEFNANFAILSQGCLQGTNLSILQSGRRKKGLFFFAEIAAHGK